MATRQFRARQLARLPLLNPHRGRHPRGQSLVEFALVLPLLLVLFLGIADFGRVFSAGIIIEAAARDAAEIVANDARMVELKDPACDATCRVPIYSALRARGAQAACDEAKRLPATTPDATGTCAGRIIVGICIHDSVAASPQSGDPGCGIATGETDVGECDLLAHPWTNTQDGISDVDASGNTQTALRFVETRICYRFLPAYGIADLPIVSYVVPSVYLQRDRTFIVSADY